jgi:RNA polymerase sigma-70 factor (ECF subfamily)
MSGISRIGFESVFDKWYIPIRNFLYFKTGDIQAAEDLAQDTFFKLWEKRNGVKPETVKQLLYTIANNMYINQLNHKKVVMKFNENYRPENHLAGPDFELELKEFDKKLQSALGALDEKNRTVFLLNRMEKLTYSQIAENLGITVKAVEKRMEKALGFLRNKIEMNI